MTDKRIERIANALAMAQGNLTGIAFADLAGR